MTTAPHVGIRGDEALPAGDRSFRVLVHASAELIAVVDPTTRVLYANQVAEAVLAPSGDGLVGGDLAHRVHPEDRPRFTAHVAALAASPGAVSPDLFRVAADGDWRTLEVTLHNLSADPAVRGIVVNGRDVTDRANVQRALATLSQANQLLIHARDETALLTDLCTTIVTTAGYRLAWVGYAETDADRTVRPIAAAGEVDYLDGLHVSWGDDDFGRGPTGTAIRTGQVQVVRDTATDSSYRPWRQGARAHRFRSSCALPFTVDDRTRGALNIYADELGAFDPPALHLLTQLTGDLAYGVARLRDADTLARSLKGTIQAVAAAAELRDPYTAGHQRRVAELARAIAGTMGLSEHDIEGIGLAGTVHDIGKIGVPIEILTTNARLTPLQYELIKQHPKAGHDLLAGIDFPWPVAEVVLQHHERLDGSGYPGGLAGDEILVEARIISVADVVEAMAAHRPYRPARGLDLALDEIRRGAGTRYDPDAVRACATAFGQEHFTFTAQ